MSLNWREIDKILSELPLKGLYIRRIRQPDYRQMIFEFSGKQTAGTINLAVTVVLSTPFIRMHRISTPLPPALPRPPRFNALLKSRLQAARLESVEQLGTNRIVRFTFRHHGTVLYLDAKMWGGAANIILSDEDALIIDAFSRRPRRGEIPGNLWQPGKTGPALTDSLPDDSRLAESQLGEAGFRKPSQNSEQYTVRDFEGQGDFNSRVETHYRLLERQTNKENSNNMWIGYLERQEKNLKLRLQHINKNLDAFEKKLVCGHWADLILANLHNISPSAAGFDADDWNKNGLILHIPLDPTLSAKDNAQRYYQRQRRAKRGITRLGEDRRATESALLENTELLKRLESGKSSFDVPPPVHQSQRNNPLNTSGGLMINRPPYIILVGRNAKESDHILRHWAKGNDYWMHARDFPGGHVFIRPPKGKSVPLDILLDAANLALSYSKASDSASADLYYTQVKYLRRPKNASIGTVLPTNEKNIRVSKDPLRLESLKQAAAVGLL